MTHPNKPGYYWAKLVTPDYGGHANEDWSSLNWEIVEVHDNNGTGDEEFSVSVFGVPVIQWPKDFEWGPAVGANPPA